MLKQFRAIIPNDSILFAQSDCDESILYFVTSDSGYLNTYKIISRKIDPTFIIIDINILFNEQFGILNFNQNHSDVKSEFTPNLPCLISLKILSFA